MPCGVDVILGMNGYVWVSKHVQENRQVGEEGFDAEAVYSNVNDVRTNQPLIYKFIDLAKFAVLNISVTYLVH